MHSVASVIAKASHDPNGQHEQPQRFTHKDGCYRLLWELLLDVFAVSCLSSLAAKRQAALDREWVESDDTSPFSFVWCCQHLSLSPLVVRAAYLSGRIHIVQGVVVRPNEQRACNKAVEELLRELYDQMLAKAQRSAG